MISDDSMIPGAVLQEILFLPPFPPLFSRESCQRESWFDSLEKKALIPSVRLQEILDAICDTSHQRCWRLIAVRERLTVQSTLAEFSGLFDATVEFVTGRCVEFVTGRCAEE